jgi:hypothetical protein
MQVPVVLPSLVTMHLVSAAHWTPLRSHAPPSDAHATQIPRTQSPMTQETDWLSTIPHACRGWASPAVTQVALSALQTSPS